MNSKPKTPVLKMTARNVSVAYGSKLAIDNVSIDVDQDEVVASSARRAAASRPSCARSTA
jgi:ABC-type multidrug transport system fused ATPase/permease subunit